MKTNCKSFSNKEAVLLLSVLGSIYSHYAAITALAIFASMVSIDSIGGVRSKKAVKNIAKGSFIMVVMLSVAFVSAYFLIKH